MIVFLKEINAFNISLRLNCSGLPLFKAKILLLKVDCIGVCLKSFFNISYRHIFT